MSEFTILAIPFLGTSLGSAMVFFLKKRIAPKFEKLLLGFAAGVMIAASVWSLLIPSIDMCKGNNSPEWLAALVGFLAGIFFLLLLDTVIPHMHIESKNQEGIKTAHISKTTMMLFAVTLHNIPEGMSVGVAFAGAMMKDSGITAAAAMALAIGIAIQNFPEGAIISMPLRGEGMSKKKSICMRSAVWNCRTCWRVYHNPYCWGHRPCSSLSAFICSRCNDVRCNRRTHT